MYLTALITVDLSYSNLVLRPPSSFFAGLANLLTEHHWSSHERVEVTGLLTFAQLTYRALRRAGVSDVIRVSVGDAAVYEDLEERRDDLVLANEALQKQLRALKDPD